MEKDRGKRYQNAAEMKADLQHLKKETESGVTRLQAKAPVPLKATHTFQETSSRPMWITLARSRLR